MLPEFCLKRNCPEGCHSFGTVLACKRVCPPSGALAESCPLAVAADRLPPFCREDVRLHLLGEVQEGQLCPLSQSAGGENCIVVLCYLVQSDAAAILIIGTGGTDLVCVHCQADGGILEKYLQHLPHVRIETFAVPLTHIVSKTHAVVGTDGNALVIGAHSGGGDW